MTSVHVKQRDYYIDFAKGLACLLMAAGHTQYYTLWHPHSGLDYTILWLIAEFAIPLFFMASGINVVTQVERMKVDASARPTIAYLGSIAWLFFLGFVYSLNRRTLGMMDLFHCVAMGTAVAYIVARRAWPTWSIVTLALGSFALAASFSYDPIPITKEMIDLTSFISMKSATTHMIMADIYHNAVLGLAWWRRLLYVHFAFVPWVGLFMLGVALKRVYRTKWEAVLWILGLTIFAAGLLIPFTPPRGDVGFFLRGKGDYVTRLLLMGLVTMIPLMRWYKHSRRGLRGMTELIGKESFVFFVCHWVVIEMSASFFYIFKGFNWWLVWAVQIPLNIYVSYQFTRAMARWRDKTIKKKFYPFLWFGILLGFGIITLGFYVAHNLPMLKLFSYPASVAIAMVWPVGRNAISFLTYRKQLAQMKKPKKDSAPAAKTVAAPAKPVETRMSEEEKKPTAEPIAEKTAEPAPAATAQSPASPEKEPAKPKPKRDWTVKRVFVLTILLLLVAGIFNGSAKPVDDAYITFRFAENLVNGNGLSYNPGTIVEGFTSMGQVLLMAPIIMMNKRMAYMGSILLGLLAWAAVVALVWRLIRRERGDQPLDRPEWFTLIFLAICNPAVIWSWSGMETTIFSLCWIAAWAVHLREYDNDEWPWQSALITFAAGLFHPEGILIAAVLGLSWFLPLRSERMKKGLAYLAIAVGLFGLYWLWRWQYFGYFFPNTYYTKVGGSILLGKGLRYLIIGALSSIVPLYMIFLLIVRRSDPTPWPRWLKLSFGMIGAVLLFNLLVGGDYFSYQRFLLPAFPFTLLATWYLWTRHRKAKAEEEAEEAEEREDEDEEAGERKSHPLLWSVIIVILLNFWGGFFLLQGKAHKMIQSVVPEFAAVGKHVARVMPEKSSIATIPIGALGFFSERKIIDIAGLTDKHIAHLDIETGERNVGHEKFDYDYVFEKKPTVIMQLPALFPKSKEGLQEWMIKTSLNPIQYNIYDYDKLKKEYYLAWLPVRKKVVRTRGKAKPEVVMHGAFGYVRKDKLGKKGYKAWEALPAAEAYRPFREVPELVKKNPLLDKNLGVWSFKGGEKTGKKKFAPGQEQPSADQATPEMPAEPIEVLPDVDAPPADEAPAEAPPTAEATPTEPAPATE